MIRSEYVFLVSFAVRKREKIRDLKWYATCVTCLFTWKHTYEIVSY